MIERYRRPDLGHLELELEIDDPTVLKKPWKQKRVAHLVPDEGIEEYVCAENTKDVEHLKRTPLACIVGRPFQAADSVSTESSRPQGRHVGLHVPSVLTWRRTQADALQSHLSGSKNATWVQAFSQYGRAELGD